MEKDEIEITSRLTRAINYLKVFLPDPSKASTDLWKFAKLNNGRNYHLIGVCINPTRDYRQVVKAIVSISGPRIVLRRELTSSPERASKPDPVATREPRSYSRDAQPITLRSKPAHLQQEPYSVYSGNLPNG